MLIVDPWNYRLLFLIRGIVDGFSFQIERQVGERLQHVVSEEEQDDDIRAFFRFESKDGQQIAVSIEDIETINYLFESGVPLTPESSIMAEEADDLYDVMLYFRNRVEPIQCVVEGREELDNVFVELETEPFMLTKFLSFTDEDGEMVMFNTQHLVLFIVKKHVWSEEFEEEP